MALLILAVSGKQSCFCYEAFQVIVVWLEQLNLGFRRALVENDQPSIKLHEIELSNNLPSIAHQPRSK